MKNRALITVLGVVVAAASQAVTIATHDDPALDYTTPLFFTTSSNVTGSWNGLGLNLQVPVASLSFTDVKMVMDSVTRTGTTLGGGQVVYYTDASTIANPIFTITFDSGVIFEPIAAGASFISLNDVTFGGSAVDGYLFENEQFSFSFANPVVGANGNSYTAAMTSSAEVVPEPATMTILAGGLAAFLARRKRNA